jgi:hypothetical protein
MLALQMQSYRIDAFGLRRFLDQRTIDIAAFAARLRRALSQSAIRGLLRSSNAPECPECLAGEVLPP